MNTLCLRPFQREALRILLKPRSAHVLCVAPTGAGKSLIFETLARRPNSSTLIISPLRALIRQQERRLEGMGIRISPGLTRSDGDSSPMAWITTPEQVMSHSRRGFRPSPTTLLVVDECHCVDEWGEEFRPEFRELPGLPARWGLRQSLWLSATLTAPARRELEAMLPGNEAAIHRIGGFALHPRLHISRFRIALRSRHEFLLRWLAVHREPGILFCSSRRSCEEVGRLLEAVHGKAAGIYHAGMVREERLAIEQRAAEGSLRWLAATSAFGMGMNFSQFNWVVLCEPPYTVLSLAQMLGRCGRSPNASPRAAILWDHPELERLSRLQPASAGELRDLLEGSVEPAAWLGQYFS